MIHHGSRIRITRSPPQQMGAILSTIHGDDYVIYRDHENCDGTCNAQTLDKSFPFPLCLNQNKSNMSKPVSKQKQKKSPVSGPLYSRSGEGE